MPTSEKKTKVAILGGGVSAMTAAFELTNTKDLRDKYDVTVYQMGWRIGGKGASGRNSEYFERIEEHGLHIWFGFYENAFQAIARLYEELDRPHSHPLATWERAFMRTDDVVLFDDYRKQWFPGQYQIPSNDAVPTDGSVLPTFGEMAYMAMCWAEEVLEDLFHDQQSLFPHHPKEYHWQAPSWFETIARDIEVDLSMLDHAVEFADFIFARKLTEAWSKYPKTYSDNSYYDLFTKHSRSFLDWLWENVVEPNIGNDTLRVFFTFLDTAVALFSGAIEDRLFINGFDQINHLEFREWLRQKGAREISIESGPLVRAVYDVAFAYENGDRHHPNMAAGAAARGLLRLGMTYKGAFMWKMRAGMGDTIFTPFYEVLYRRGVKFKFFQWVTHLGLSNDKKFVETIDAVQQVKLKGDEYYPLVNVKDLDCWPSEPLWDQIVEGKKLKKDGIDLEETPNPLNVKPTHLHRGIDFDIVVLGISVAALPAICSELIDDTKNPRFRKMIENSATVQTQAFQLWLNQDLVDGLHWKFARNSVAGTYVEPLDTFCDMSHLIPRENWPAKYDLQSIAYFCGVLKDESDEKTPPTQEEENKKVHNDAINFLKNDSHGIWPRSKKGEFDWNWLIDPKNRQGEERFHAQYWRANSEPTERYVITPAGKVQYRLKTDESGYANLYLTGDWIKNGLDLGCVESAVMSGMQTSRAICGSPSYIIGEFDDWLINNAPDTVRTPSKKELAPQPGNYVEYGGRVTTAPMPGFCRNVDLNCFILEADYAKLKALIDRTFTVPTSGRVQYIPISKYVMLSIGDLGSISSMVEPYHSMGYVHELQVSFWVMMARVRPEGWGYIAEDLGFFIPNMWVQNPVSLAGGREVVGYNKSWGKIHYPKGVTAPEQFSLEAYGVKKFSPTEELKELPLIDVHRREGGRHTKARSWSSIEEIFNTITREFPAQDNGAFVIPGVQMSANLFDDFFRRQIPQVFLKQSRSMVDGLKADYQAVIRAPAHINNLKSITELPEYRVTIHHQDSYPLFDDLGVKSQKSLMSFEAKMDFTIENGQVLWEGPKTGTGCGCSPLGWLFAKR